MADRYTSAPRLTVQETHDLIKRLPQIRDLLRDVVSERNGKVALADGDTTASSMFLMRFSKWDTEKKKAKDGDRDRMDDQSGSEEDFSVSFKEEEKLNAVSTTSSSGGQHVEKTRRFAMSLATLSSKPEKRVNIVDEGAIPALIEMCGIRDNIIERCCATAFSFLAKEAKIRGRMIEAGAFGALMNLATSPSWLVKTDCCRAMCNLCCAEGYEAKILKEGGAMQTIALMSSCPEVMDICLTILLNLSCLPEKYNRVEDVTEALMHTVSGHVKLNEGQECLIVSAMVNLSALRGNQLKMVEDGCLRFVEKILKSTAGYLRVLAAEVIRNMTTDYRTRGKLVESNIIQTLLQMSRDEVEDVKMSCVKAFYNLARDVMCREKIVNANAVQVIVKMSMSTFEDVEMGRTAARILRILCGDRMIAFRLVSDGIIKALMALLRTEDGVIYQNCAESVCSLFQIGSVLGRLIEQGAVGVLVSLSQTNNDKITGEWCSFALCHLAINKICPTSIIEHGILPCVIKLCSDEANCSERTKYFCAASLSYITQLGTIDASGSIPLLVSMLRQKDTTDAVTKNYCACALYNMVDHDENCFLMLEAGALRPVVDLIASNGEMQTTMKCAAILSRLSLHKQYYSQFASNGVLKVLLELSSVDHILTQRRVVIAISNLSQNEELRAQLIDLKPIPYIISLASKRDENLRRGCASIVCNLAYEVGTEAELAEAGIVPTLLITAMITSDQVSCKIICVKALVNLMADRSLYKSMVKEGIVWGLSTLALIDDDELLHLCANALCSLSCDFARDLLDSPTTVKMVVKLINNPDVELLRAGARALTNLLLKTNDTADEAFRRNAVENMLAMAQSTDEEISEMCILCLCLASQSESCREVIVSSGLLGLIDSSSIFTEARVCYAYLTMFGNIANNPLMRKKLLDDRAIQRFRQICVVNDPQLDFAVAKAVYCVSCAPENIAKLAEQNILPMIQTMWDAEYEKTPEFLHHLAAILYNMTTNAETQGKIVSQGIVEVIMELWGPTRKDLKMATLICGAVCHLACGQVNTARLVEDGCTQILCFMVKCKSYEECTNFTFPLEMYERCAAGLRNLLCVVPNQMAMVQAGCIDALVTMAIEAQQGILAESFLQRRKRGAGTSTSAASTKQQLQQQQGKLPDFQSPELQAVYGHCASALRSMTFNEEIRDHLLASGAMDVILADLKKHMSGDEINIGYNLLSELEAESWQNGSKGRQREGRAKPIDPAGLWTDLLRSTVNVQLDVDIRFADLEKFHVQAQLDEPKIEMEVTETQLDVGIADLASFDDLEENVTPEPMLCVKLEVDIDPDALSNLFKRDPSVATEDDAKDNQLGAEDSITDPAVNVGPGNSSWLGGSDMSHSQSLPGLPNHHNHNQNRGNSAGMQGFGGSRGAFPGSGSAMHHSSDFPKLGGTSSAFTKKKERRKSPEEKFSSLVSLISHAKKVGTKTADNKGMAASKDPIDDVITGWRKVWGGDAKGEKVKRKGDKTR